MAAFIWSDHRSFFGTIWALSSFFTLKIIIIVINTNIDIVVVVVLGSAAQFREWAISEISTVEI